MGRKTHESIGRWLPERVNIVLTRNRKFPENSIVPNDCYIMYNLENSINFAQRKYPKKQIFIIGGEEIYCQALPLCDMMYLTYIDDVEDGDSYFPQFSYKDWEPIEFKKLIGHQNHLVETLKRIEDEHSKQA